jgi:hypothetical protein
MFQSINSTIAFTAVDRSQQAALWSSFFEALDSGCVGHHPQYSLLAPLYAKGDYLCEAAMASELVVEIDELVLAAELDEPPPF